MLQTLRRMIAILSIAALAAPAACGGGGGGGGGDVDILGGSGNFEGEADQALWNVMSPSGATNGVELWGGCASGSTCANVALSDYGDNDYSAQLAHWDATAEPPTFRTVTLHPDKQYVIKIWAAAEKAGDVEGVTYPIDVWLQAPDYSTTYGELSAEVPAAGGSFTSEPFTLGSLTEPVQANVVVNMGPQAVNEGVTFHLDNFQILEQPKPPPPPGIDLLGGLGSFTDETAQANWFINKSSEVTTPVNLEFSPCPEGMEGGCAVVSGETFGGTNYYTQLSFGAGAWESLPIDPAKSYRITMKAAATGCTTPVTISAWLQGNWVNAGGDWPPVNDNNWNFAVGATTADLTTANFPGVPPSRAGDTAENVRLVINLGATTGCTFYFDDIQVLELDE